MASGKNQEDYSLSSVGSVDFEDVIASPRKHLTENPTYSGLENEMSQQPAPPRREDVNQSYDKNIQKLDNIHRLLETAK